MLRIMTVEDDVYFREFFRSRFLSQYPSAEVIDVGSGEEALKSFGSYPIDLIFMDIHLPGQNGLEITRKIKATQREITIAILTTYNLPEYRQAAIQCEADCFIAKDLLKNEEILTLIRCHEKAKRAGRKPTCVQLASG